MAEECFTQQDVELDDLRSIDVLQGVDLEQVYGLLKSCPVQSLAPEETLIAAGEPSTCVYILLSGRLRVHLKDVHSDPLNILEPGQMVGEIGVMDNLLRSSCVISDVPSRVLTLKTDVYWSLVYASHEFAINLLAMQSQRLRNNTDNIRRVTRLKEQFRQHAVIDGLTGLYNRRWLNDMLPRQMKRSLLNREPLSLVMIDIDFFKQFNDTHGHQAGDFVLFEVGRLLKALFRPEDSVVRYGGEEFTVLLPNAAGDLAYKAADRVRRAIAAQTLCAPDTAEHLSITLSMGLAVLDPSHTMESFIRAADRVLYQAKQTGRNQVCCSGWSPEQDR